MHVCNKCKHTHIQSAFSADVWPTDQLVTVASQSESDASCNTPSTTLWTLAVLNSWICQIDTDSPHHQHQRSQSPSNTASKTPSSALSPSFPAADQWTSTIKHYTEYLYARKRAREMCDSVACCDICYLQACIFSRGLDKTLLFNSSPANWPEGHWS